MESSNNSSSEDPMLNYKAFFILKNHDEADQISVVATGEQHIVRILERFIELL